MAKADALAAPFVRQSSAGTLLVAGRPPARLVAPVYLIRSVGLSYLSAPGLAILVFVVIGGAGGLSFVLRSSCSSS